MADGKRSGSSSPQRFKGSTPGENSPTKARASPKGVESSNSMRSGGRDTPRSQHSPTSSNLSPPPERGGEVREAGEEISPKRTASPNRGASPANLHEKTVASDSPSSARVKEYTRASPGRAGMPTRRTSPVRADPFSKPGASSPKHGEAGVPKPGDASPVLRGSPMQLHNIRVPKTAGQSPARGPAKPTKSGSASPKRRSSPKQQPILMQAGTSSTPPGVRVRKAEGSPAKAADGSPNGRRSPSGGSTPIRRAFLGNAGAAAAPKPQSAKAEVGAKPADDAGSTRSPTETRRRPTISLKDPRYRYIAQALMAARGGRGAGGTSGSSSPNGRTSPSATPYFASDDDNTILELGTSQVPHSPGGFGGRSSGTASPVISQRASIQLSSAFRNKSSAFHPGSEIRSSVRSWPWRESANDDLSPSKLRHGGSQSPLAGGTKYDGQKRSKPSFLVLTGACLLALLLSAIVLVVVLHMISNFNAPSRQKHAGVRNTNTSTKSPRFGTGVAGTSGVGGSATEVGRVQTSPPPYSSWRHA
ncbi:nascent polypeptide-associated complex subunit alpha, muscle-specific form-like [Dermacentor albipictus]|uniref:nascent polypeptide-associated complex subunit alpha, muscle-specific form-like n=1 Tax=Dermacentor albipictus TaxID=60249 RepID=UPI0038FC15AC